MTEPPSVTPPAPVTRAAAVHPAKGWTLFEENGHDEVGRVVDGRFEILARIGDGGMARVFACRDLVLGSLAALKVIKGDNLDARRRFAEEALVLANVRHPHLVAVLMTGQTEDGAPYMVLEYLPGRSLDERLRDDGPMPWREVVQIATQITGALEVLHRQGVIHRDVKPSNIMQLDTATGQLIVKLIDLGIVKVHDWQRVQAVGFKSMPRHQTELGKVVGTPGFYPPESGMTPPDPRFDVFGVGVTIYQLCTGEMPDLINPRPMRHVRAGCEAPPELDAVVMAALAVLPDDRIGTIEELRLRLEAIRVDPREGPGAFLFEGCFELLEVVGVGAKAEVYRAFHRDARKYMALKVLSAKARELPEERARFAREAQILYTLAHPAIPTVYECRTSDRHKAPYIAMAMARGRRAGEFCSEATRLKPAEVIAVGRQLASALVAAHACGVLHRDINTSNVLIERGLEPTATLVDFGMADVEAKFYAVVEQRYPTPPEARGKLGTGGIEGLEWTAPEARSGQGWTAVSDVYSLALLLYRLLTGKRPTRGRSTQLIDPREVVGDCPAGLAMALLGGLEGDPACRLDAAGLLQRLTVAEGLHESEMDDEEEATEARQTRSVVAVAPVPNPESAATPEQGAPAMLTASRRWARPAVGAVGVAVVAVLAVAAWWTREPGHPAPTTADTPTLARSGPSPAPAPTPTTEASPSKIPAPTPAGSAADRLADAGPALTNCAHEAGQVVFTELKTSPGKPHFTAMDVDCENSEGIRCTREVLEQIRFEPPAGASIFVKEYRP